MDPDSLVDEIARRVIERIGGREIAAGSNTGNIGLTGQKAAALVLSCRNAGRYRAQLGSLAVSHRYEIDYLCANERQVDISRYEAVVLLDLSLDALAEMACGTADRGYSLLAEKALLLGKRIIVPRQEVELFRFKDTAPERYYKMMLEKLNFLTDSGVVFCEADELEAQLLSQNAPKAACELELNRSLITEADVKSAATDGTVCLLVHKNALITALAADCAKQHAITIKRK